MEQITVKAKCKGITRILRIPTDVSFVDFCELLGESFGIAEYQLQYKDEEDDVIHLGSEVELEEALKVAERFPPLKVIILTSEKPKMDFGDKATNPAPSLTSSESTSSLRSTSSSQNGPSTPGREESREDFVNTMSDLKLDDNACRPRHEAGVPKAGKRSRKRVGFYASLCNEVKNLGLTGSNETTQALPLEKPKKKQKHNNSRKYYSSLAADVAAMKLLQIDHSGTTSSTAAAPERPEPAVPERPLSDEPAVPENLSVSDLKITPTVTPTVQSSQDDRPPPSWCNNTCKMSQKITPDLYNALNGTVIATSTTVNGQAALEIKTDHRAAAHVHDEISCDSCHQPIIGSRYKCGNCPDYDLCEKCEGIAGVHSASHVFLKLRYPDVGIGRKHGVMIPILKDIIYKSKDLKQAEVQERTMKEVRKKLKQLAKKKREEQVRLKKGERRKKFKGSNHSDGLEFLGDGSYPDGSEVAPGHEFTKIWKIKNTGSTAWNGKSKLVCRYGSIHFDSREIDLPRLQSGEEGTVRVQFTASTNPGQYTSVWRASQDGKVFGCQIWCKIIVPGGKQNQSDDDDDTFVDAHDTPPAVAPTELVPMPPRPAQDVPQAQDIEISQGMVEDLSAADVPEVPGDPESDTAVVSEEENHGEVEASSSDVSNVTACELEWDKCMMQSEEEEEDDDDLVDIEVISNVSSDDDYCVVPLPPCFNPDIPLDHAQDPYFAPEAAPQTLVKDAQAPHLDIEASPATPPNRQNVDSLVEKNLMQFSDSNKKDAPVTPNTDTLADELSTALNINTSPNKLKPRSCTASLPIFPVKSAISKPVAFQPPVTERTAFVPGRIPASPPGRAVPVVQPTHPKVSTRHSLPLPPPREEPLARDPSSEQTSPQTICLQPPEPMLLTRSLSETTVTSQPTAVVTVATPPQSTAQFASTLVSGTLETAKRAIGTVTGTVTTFINGQSSTVTYDHTGENVQIVTSTTEPSGPAPWPDMAAMQQLIDMGFCDRPLNERLLKKYKNDINEVAMELIHENDNNWSRDRHTMNN